MSHDIHIGSLQQAIDDQHHAGPLPQHAGPIGTAERSTAREKRSWSEERWRRRKRRLWFEEVLGWILVPIIVIAVVWGVKGGLAAFGTTPTALYTGIKQAISGKS